MALLRLQTTTNPCKRFQMIRTTLRFLLTSGLPTILVATTLAQTTHAQGTCGTNPPYATCTTRPHAKLDIDAFADQIADELGTLGLKGYSISVFGEDGNLLPRLDMSQGLASGPTETTIPFTSDVASAVGSVSKLITEGAVRHAIEINNEANAVPASCKVHLDTPFLDVLPAAFRRAAGPSSYYNSSTVEQVLRHQAGVPTTVPTLADGNPDHWRAMKRPSELQECARGTYCYGNENYVLAGVMLPLIRDCSLKAEIDDAAQSFCFRNAPGQSKDTCEIQYAVDELSVMSNEIAKAMVIDPLDARANCDYRKLIGGNIMVARGFASGTAASGTYLGADLRGCSILGWHVPTNDLGRIMRRFWDGAFFNHASMGYRMPESHGGAVAWSANGVLGHYRGLASTMIPTTFGGENITVAFVANSPVQPGVIDGIVYNAFVSNARSTPEAVSHGVMTSARGTWTCTQIEVPTNTMSLRIGSSNDIKGFNRMDFGGWGSEELWFPWEIDSVQSNGEYVYYQAGTSPKATTNVYWGRYYMRQDATTGNIKIRRTDNATNWQGNYNCVLDADQ